MSWEPDLSLALDEFRLTDLDFISSTTKNFRMNLVPYFEELKLVEDIDSPFLRGTLKFNILKGELKSQGLDVTLQDFIVISVSSIDSISMNGKEADFSEPRQIGGVFYITDISKRDATDPKVDSYTIQFASTEVLNEFSKKISRSYKDKTREEIIKNITDEFLVKDSFHSGQGDLRKGGIFEKTKDKFQCVIPRWSPVKTIKWLSSGCVSTENDDSMSFHFFQTFERKLYRSFNFRSIRTMLRQKPSIGVEDNFLSGYGIYPYDSNVNEKMKRNFARRTALKCVISDVAGLRQLSSGSYSSKLLSHDIIRKSFTETKFDYDNKTAANPDKNQGFLIEDNKVQDNFANKFLKTGDNFVKMDMDHKNLFRKSETNLGVNKTETWFQDRMSQKNFKDYLTMDVTFYGDTSRNVGETVMFTSPGAFDKFESESSDINGMEMDASAKDLAGKYLITKIVHSFNVDTQNGSLPGRNTSIMTLMKDGLPK